ncbi:hypothetical protein D6851_03685 [Altericroceibacterium spongiae]|uniref:DUF7007 domain-containing protein n=1 Tax=Altericroceibacterium spongiae TaxID=2320269 RepID=A0A420ENV0_9SPHN|nr:hypothetical protein [Altericroceibacterium spongiae]RKF22348.1 hypothetical protein D6851_03685 [Altericroceibacterium spongiae]
MTKQTIEAVFLHTRDGRLAAMVDDYCYLAVPAGDRWRIAGAWRLAKPAETWEPADFYTYQGFVDSEDAFRDYVEDYATHRRQLLTLSRQQACVRIVTPWGQSDSSEIYGEGVVFHSTPSHGGFKLDAIPNAQVPEALRNADGWYEEDCEWAKVTIAFPALFTDRERRQADETIRNQWPDYWETVYGQRLAPGESRTKDERAFRYTNAQRWVVVSAIRSDYYPGMVECTAMLGGQRGFGRTRSFLVPSGEYAPGRFGFVIDETRHQEI